MDDIKAAAIRRFENALQQSNWDMVLDTKPVNPVSVWIYSASIDEGVRVIGQLTLDAYRQSNSSAGMPSVPGLTPWGALDAAYHEFDALATDEERYKAQSGLSAAILSYASATQTWKLMPPLNSGIGVHVVVADWHTSKGVRILKPAMATGHEILTKEKLGELVGIMVGMHVSKNPHEGPVDKG